MLNLSDLHKLAEAHGDFLRRSVREFDIGGHPFPFNKQPHLMGVINLSSDSWYRESVCLSTEQAIRRGRQLHAQGAHIVDVGAESSLLNATHVDEKGQQDKLIPVIRGLKKAGILVSTETYHPSVAEACLKAGASVLNLTGTVQTRDFFKMAAKHKTTVILCYVEGRNVRSVKNYSLDNDMIPRMEKYFESKIEEAKTLGVSRIILDPGLGFYYRNLQDSATRIRNQMRIFLNTFRLQRLGQPICHALPHAFEYFEDEVRSAESFFAVLALLGRTHLLRTHEIPKVRAVCQTLNAYS